MSYLDESWHCPICGFIAHEWQDGLDHIIKEHILEYKRLYHMTRREYNQEVLRV